MLADYLLPSESSLRIDGVGVEDQTITITVSSVNPVATCPYCGTVAKRVHDRYQRRPADLPMTGTTVRLQVTIRCFFCDNAPCTRRTFAERMPALLRPRARRTHRLAQQQQLVAFVVGGEAGSRLLDRMGMPVSADTLLRMIRNAPEREDTPPRVLGVDDWAKRKGHSYGTILVDQEIGEPIDLLPECSAASLEAWLKAHPGVEVITRDRSGEFIKAATEGAPEALQVADRWHLLKNLRDNLTKWLENRRTCLKAAAQESDPEKPAETTSVAVRGDATPQEPQDTLRRLTQAETVKEARHRKRQERYQTIQRLHGGGVSKSEIARRLGMDRRTVRKYAHAATCPMSATRIRRSKLDPYKDYIAQRWRAGCHNAAQILREIRALGFQGSRSTMTTWVTRALRPPNTGCRKASMERTASWSPRRASWLLVKRPEKLTDSEHAALERMFQVDAKVRDAHTLAQRFARMIRERDLECLRPWLDDAAASGIDALGSFAKSIRKDIVAVIHALTMPWSQGRVEGHVNRLKLIKRQMYGRANFDLLRKRVLAYPMRC